MARLKVLPYELQACERARHYFAQGMRKGILVAWFLGEQVWGIGEYAPLLGMHRVSLEQTLTILEQLPREYCEDFLPSADPSSKIDEAPYPLSLLLSTMSEHHACLQQERPAADQKLTLSALITATDNKQAVSDAEHFLRLGYSYLKLKIGSQSIAQEAAKIKHIDSLSAGKAILRLDANKRYGINEALQLLQEIKGANIQYIEEPLADVSGIAMLKERSAFDIAIDESYDASQPLVSFKEQGLSFLIIKASRFRSLFEVKRIVEEARACGIRPIFSTCFESEFFSSVMALLVAKLGLLQEAHGLWCPGIFANSLYDRPLAVSGGELRLDEAYRFLLDQESRILAGE